MRRRKILALDDNVSDMKMLFLSCILWNLMALRTFDIREKLFLNLVLKLGSDDERIILEMKKALRLFINDVMQNARYLESPLK